MGPAELEAIRARADAAPEFIDAHSNLGIGGPNGVGYVPAGFAAVKFITNAATDIPALCVEVDRLRAAIREWVDAVAHQNDDFDPTVEYAMDPGMERVDAAERALRAALSGDTQP